MASLSNSRNWMFTLNNPTSDCSPNLWPCVKFIVYQLEQGESGTPHYQGYVMFTKNMRLAGLRKIQQCHWEPRRGSHDQAVAYCSKEDTRISGPWTFGKAPEQGKRTDAEAVKVMIDEGATMPEIFDQQPSFVFRYYSNIQKCIQLKIVDRTSKPLVVVHYGPPGVGKSTSVARFIGDETCFRKEPNHNWWEGYDNQKHVILDEFCGGIPFSSLKVLLDRFPNTVEVKNGHKKFTSEVIHIISNNKPDTWYADTYDFRALHRRIDFMLEYTAVGVEPTISFDHRKESFSCDHPNCPVRDLFQFLNPDEDYEEPQLIEGVPRKRYRVPSPDRCATSSQEEEFRVNNHQYTGYSSTPNPASSKSSRTQ